MAEFNKKNILILGCARGIGRVLAEQFSSRGANLILVDIGPRVHDLAAQLRGTSSSVDAHTLDLSSTLNVEESLPKIIGNRCLDGIVYVTGCRSKKKFNDFESSDWDFVVNTSLKNVFFSAKSLRKNFSKDSPFFITISSVAARVVGGECVGYHCAKAGLEQLTRYLAVELGRDGVRVNAVQPGMIVREEHQSRFMSVENVLYREMSNKAHPLNYVGDSNDVVEAILYLASKKSKFVTGQVLVVDGGLTIQDQFDVAHRFSK